MLTVTQPDLIPGLVAQEEGAVNAFVERYWASAYRVALQLTNDPGAAEDVAQDAFVAALRGVDALSPGDPLRAWFFRILENTAKKHHRTEQRREARHQRRAEREHRVSQDPARALEREEERELVKAHLADLSPKLRYTLALRYLEGLSLAEVARVLDIPRQTVSSRIRLGLDALRESLVPQLALSALALPLLIQEAMAAPVPPVPAGSGLLLAAQAPPPPAAADLIAKARKPALALPATLLALLGGALLGTFLLAENGTDPTAATGPGTAPVESADRLGGRGADSSSGDVARAPLPTQAPQGSERGSDPGSSEDATRDADAAAAPSPAPRSTPAPDAASTRDGNWVVHGTVLAAGTGEPIAGAKVTGYYYTRAHWPDPGSPYGETYFGTSAQTDAAGRFRVALEAPHVGLEEVTRVGEGRALHFMVEAEGYSVAKEDRVVVDPRRGLELRLDLGVVVRGRVVDALTDRPIRAATVSLSEERRMGIVPQTLSDAGGGFSMSVTPHAQYELSAEAEGYVRGGLEFPARGLEDAPPADAVLRLHRAAHLEVQVVDEAGDPVEASIEISKGSGWENRRSGRSEERLVERRPEDPPQPFLGVTLRGGLALGSVLAGSPAEQAGLRPGDRIVRLDGEQVADVRALRRIVGRKQAGDPLQVDVHREGAPVSLRVTLGATRSKLRRVIVPARFEGLLPGAGYTIRAKPSKPGSSLRTCSTQVDLVAGRNPAVRLVLASTPSQRALGVRVLDPEGEPVAGVRVYAQECSAGFFVDGGGEEAITDGAGRVSFETKAGLYRFQVGALVAADPYRFEPGSTRPIELRVPGRRRVHGTVVDAKGDPVSMATLSAAIELGARWRLAEVRADGNGRFEIPCLPERLGAGARLRNGAFGLPWSRAIPDEESGSIQVQLPQPRVVRLRFELLSEGAPPELSVHAQGATYQDANWERRDRKWIGTLELNPDFAGPLVLRPQGCLPLVHELDKDATSAELEVPLTRGTNLLGLVRDASGAPLRGVCVAYARYPGLALGFSNEAGRFELPGVVPPAGCELRLTRHGREAKIVVAAGQSEFTARLD